MSEILNKKFDLYDYKNEIKNNEKKINSFLSKINSNYISNLTQRNNNITEPNNSSFNENKAKKINNKENESCQFLCPPSYKLEDKIKDNHILPYSNDEITNANHYNITIYNNFTDPKFKQTNILNKNKINNKSNSISSLNEMKLYSNQNKKVIHNKYNYYSQNTFINNYKFDNDSIISQKYVIKLFNIIQILMFKE